MSDIARHVYARHGCAIRVENLAWASPRWAAIPWRPRQRNTAGAALGSEDKNPQCPLWQLRCGHSMRDSFRESMSNLFRKRETGNSNPEPRLRTPSSGPYKTSILK